MEWRKVEHKYGPDSNKLYLGKMHVATVNHASYSRSEGYKHACYILLPGMKDKFTNSMHDSEVIAMEFAESIVTRWVDSAGLAPKP